MVQQLIISGNCGTQYYRLSSDVTMRAFRVRQIHIPYTWYNFENQIIPFSYRLTNASPLVNTSITLDGNYTTASLLVDFNQVLPNTPPNNGIYFRLNPTKARVELYLYIANQGDSIEFFWNDAFFHTVLGFTPAQTQQTVWTATANNQYFFVTALEQYNVNPIMLSIHLPQFARFTEHVSTNYQQEDLFHSQVAHFPINANFNNVIQYTDSTHSLIQCNEMKLNFLHVYFSLNNTTILQDPRIQFWLTVDYE